MSTSARCAGEGAVQHTSPTTPRRLRIARLAVSGYFFVNGVAFSSWVARIPDVKRSLRLGDAGLSLALMAASVGTVIGLLTAGRLVDRYRSAAVSRVASLAVSLSLVGPGLAPDAPLLLAALLLFGLAGGAYNVSMNAQAVHLDRLYGRPVIASIHATYSAGALVGSGLGILLVRLEISPGTGLTALGLLLATAAWLCGQPGGLPEDGGAGHGEQARTGWLEGMDLRVLVIGACCFACLLAEGAIADWIAVYLRDHASAPYAFAPAGFLVFSLAMAVGRMTADRIAARISSMTLVPASALLAAVGLTAGLMSPHWLGTLTGLGVFGLGLSCIMPHMYKVAAAQYPSATGRSVAVVSTFGYLGLMGGPAVIGLLSLAVGLTWALGLLVVLMGTIALAAPLIRSWQGGPPKDV